MLTSNGRCEKVFFFFSCLKRCCAFWVELNCLFVFFLQFIFQISWDLENMTVSYHLAKPNKNERKKNIYRSLLDENQLSISSGLHEFKNDLPDEHFDVGIVNRCQLKMHRLQLVNQIARIWRAGNSPIEFQRACII